LFLEAANHGAERAGPALFWAGMAGFIAATSADGAVHLLGWHGLEPAAHTAIFSGMALAWLGLALRGAAAHRKERSHAVR
jgi:hypothetical protein